MPFQIGGYRRLIQLNQLAITQMKSLLRHKDIIKKIK